jgi:hypothetical protein
VHSAGEVVKDGEQIGDELPAPAHPHS